MHLLDRVQSVYDIHKATIQKDNTIYCTIKSGGKEHVITREHLSFLAKCCECSIEEIEDSIKKMNGIPEQTTKQPVKASQQLAESFKQKLLKVAKEK